MRFNTARVTYGDILATRSQRLGLNSELFESANTEGRLKKELFNESLCYKIFQVVPPGTCDDLTSPLRKTAQRLPRRTLTSPLRKHTKVMWLMSEACTLNTQIVSR